jgi:hypothetical protein
VPSEFCSDRIGALPDALLHHVLSLLPAEEAVRTSVLARRWRYLWKFAAGLCLGCLDMEALDCLEFKCYDLSLATKIMSESLKSLTIKDSCFCQNFRTQICTPNLIALCLDDLWNKTPILESMPSLVDAFVQITVESSDRCGKLWDAHLTCDCQYCDSSNNIAYGGSVLLKGLTESRNLALIGILDTV